VILFDTDHLSVLAFPGPASERLAQRMEESADQHFAIPVAAAEEQMRGWLAAIGRQRSIYDQLLPYERLAMMIAMWSDWEIARLDRLAANEFELPRRSRIRIGTPDLKIAAIALSLDALLVTRNARDFSQVPRLRFENWLD
jgi:tRNA(fMet)-specific endonuclease VapC